MRCLLLCYYFYLISYMKYSTVNPATNKLEKEFAFESQEDIIKKIEKANAGFQEWRKVPLADRITRMNKVADLMEAKAEEFGKMATLEMGKPTAEAIGEAKATADFIRYLGTIAEENLKPKLIEMGYKKAMSVYQPLGVIYSIQPWNFPIALPFMTNCQSIIAGNAVLMKPAPSCPRGSQMVEEIMHEAGFNNGEFQCVYSNTTDSDFIIGHPHIRGVNFTGSTAAGKIVASICGKHMKKGSFELGGSDPFIVLDDADLDKAAQIGAASRLMNAGQCCISAKRFIVLKEVYDAYKEKLIEQIKSYKVGDPTSAETKIGPMSRADLF